jgi:benzoyl-CoA 2,3-dioxygenase component A
LPLAAHARVNSIAPCGSRYNTYIYVCGLKGMEDVVLQALKDIGEQHQLDWEALWAKLKRGGRLHLETY